MSKVDRAVVVMGKLPLPGRVKTRLAQSFGEASAAALYRAFFLDVIEVVQAAESLAASGGFAFELCLSCALEPSEPLGLAEALVPPGWRVYRQRGSDLGERIEATRADAGASLVVIIGSDAPTMPPGRLLEAFEALAAGADAVIGPVDDGGYDLIALAGAAPELLEGIPWSTPEVAAATRAAALRSGRVLHELSLGYDLDAAEDLARVHGDPAPARHTRAAIAALDSKGLTARGRSA